MFIGHFGVAFGARRATPRLSLGTLFLAAQWLDLLWPTLLLLGVEKTSVDPALHGVTPLRFDAYPWSHSLLMVAVWALLGAAACWQAFHDRRAALVVALLVLSHWGLDALVHRPDLPLYPGGSARIGLGAWSSLPLTVAIELPLFAAGVRLYLRSTAALDAIGRWALYALLAVLLLIYLGDLAGTPPPDTGAVAWVGEAQWLLVAWGYWIDKHRRAAG